MPKVTVDQIRERFEKIEARRRHLKWKSGQPGALTHQELWSHRYAARPYLIGAPDDRLAERTRNVFMNVTELNREGKLSPVPVQETDEFMECFTHILDEYRLRPGGYPPDEVIAEARQPLVDYFEHDTPIGVTMFEGYEAPATPILVKYGRRQFLEPMLQTGELRLANAASYNDSGYLKAVRDDETSRTFFIPTYQERLAGRSGMDFQGHRMEFGDDDIILPLVFDDYYLFSLCGRIHHRMATDFGADAAIVIRDPVLFTQRLISTFLSRMPDWVSMEGPVTYYDPYRDYTKFKVPQMAKHFGYAYQKEARIAFRPRGKIVASLEPLFLSIGSMEGYADLVHL